MPGDLSCCRAANGECLQHVLTLFISDFCIMQTADRESSVSHLTYAVSYLPPPSPPSEVWYSIENSVVRGKKKRGRKTNLGKQITYPLFSDLQNLGEIGWMEEPLPMLPADLPELLNLGRTTGATLHMDELVLSNLPNVADTNRLCSNTRKACPTCLF